MSYCFLSHARADVDPYFNGFVEDFVEELRGRIGAPSVDGLAFRGADGTEIGGALESNVERELLLARTFIALLSPTYLHQATCNKEWACFEWRLRTHGGPTPPELLLPLIWIPVSANELPEAIRRRQHAHKSLGTTYATRGLRTVVQNGGAEYRAFLTALAERVRDLVRLPELASPAHLEGPHELPDPFELEKPVEVLPVASRIGPKHVEFVVVAARRPELQTERIAVNAYGSDFDEWCPYLPKLETRVGLLLQKIALQENLTAGFFSATHNLIPYLQHARAKNTLVVLVVDVWSLRLPTYRSYMNTFDRAERFANAGVLVVWNFADEETIDSKCQLVESLRIAFPNLTAIKDPPAFHEQLGTPDELDRKLRATLCVLRRRIADFGDVMRRAEGLAAISKPLLVGPGAA